MFICTYTYIYIYIGVFSSVCVNTYICICMYTFVCMCTYFVFIRHLLFSLSPFAETCEHDDKQQHSHTHSREHSIH